MPPAFLPLARQGPLCDSQIATVPSRVLATLGGLQVTGTKPALSLTHDLSSIPFGSRKGAPTGGKATSKMTPAPSQAGRRWHRAVECLAAEPWAQHPSTIQLMLCPTALKLGFASQNSDFVRFVLESWSQRQKAVYYLLGHTACKREGCLCWAC